MPLGISVLGRRRKVSTREPGDLPSAVVTREDVGRGVQTLASPGCEGTMVGLVRCDVPLSVIPRSRPCLPPLQPHRGAAVFCSPPALWCPFSHSAFLPRRHSRPRPINCPRSTSTHPSIRPEPEPNQSPTRARDRHGRYRTRLRHQLPAFRQRITCHRIASSTAS